MTKKQVFYVIGFWAAFTYALELCLWSGTRFGIPDLVALMVGAYCIFEPLKNKRLDVWEKLSLAALAAVVFKHGFCFLETSIPMGRLAAFGGGGYMAYVIIKLLNIMVKGKVNLPTDLKNEKYPIHFDSTGKHYLSTGSLSRHVQVIGTTGYGKSVFMESAIYQVIRLGAGAFIFDPKSNSSRWVAYCCQRAGRSGSLKYFDPSEPERSMTTNPLFGRDSDEVYNKIHLLLNPNKNEENTHYVGISRQVVERIVPMILRESNSVTFYDLDQIFTQEITTFKTLNYLCRRQAGTPESKFFLENWITKGVDERQRDLSGFQQKVSRFVGKKWSNLVNSRNPQIVISEIMRKNEILLYATSAMLNLEDSKPLIISAQLDIMGESAKRLKNPPVVPFFNFLDEFYNATFPDFIDLLNKCRQGNVPCFLAHQSIADLLSVSEMFKQQVLELTTSKVILRVNDVATADYFSKLLGTKITEKSVFSYNTQTNQTAGKTVKPDEEFVFHPNVLKQRGRGDAIVYSDYDGKIISYRVQISKPPKISPEFDLARVLPKRYMNTKTMEPLVVENDGILTQGQGKAGGQMKILPKDESGGQGGPPIKHVPYANRKEAIEKLPKGEKDILKRISERIEGEEAESNRKGNEA